MSKIVAAIGAAAMAVLVAACGASSPHLATTPAAEDTRTPAKPSPSRSAGACKLKVTTDYIVRYVVPGLAASSQEIGNVDFANCTPTLQDFASEQPTEPGDCTSIALASENPRYNVNSTAPAMPLHHVILAIGPAC